MTFKLWQGGIGLPEREYYFKSDSATVNIRNQYVAYIAKVFTMSGEGCQCGHNRREEYPGAGNQTCPGIPEDRRPAGPGKNYNKNGHWLIFPKWARASTGRNISRYWVKGIDSVVVDSPNFSMPWVLC